MLVGSWNLLTPPNLKMQIVYCKLACGKGSKYNIYMDREGWLFVIRITDQSMVVPVWWNVAMGQFPEP